MKRAILPLVFWSCLSSTGLCQTAHIDKAKDAGTLVPLPMSVGGRVLHQTDASCRAFGTKCYVYQWPGTYFEAAFRGHEIFFEVGRGDEILHVTVDHQNPLVLVKPEPGVYSVSGLSDGSHSVRLEVVSESQGGPDGFGGFALPASGKILKPKKRRRQIEFIGDSHTVGYGNTSQTRECPNDGVWRTTDNSQAFGALTAKHYNADYQINAISGRGIVRNYNGFVGDPVPVAYPYVLFDKKDRYEDRSWQPQIIVIALGANDFSTPLNAGERWKSREELHTDYEKTYTQFVQSLRKDHPHAYFLLWATDAANGEIQSEVKKVVSQLAATGETRVALIPVNGLSMNACDWHPSIADDQRIAGKLMEFIDANPKLWQGK